VSDTRSKLMVALRVDGSPALYCRVGLSGPWSKGTLSAGLYYPSGDGQGDDLLDALTGAVDEALSETVIFGADNTTGIVSATLTSSAGIVQIAEADPTGVDPDNIRGLLSGIEMSALRFPDSLSAAVGEAGFALIQSIPLPALRTHRGGLYPQRTRTRDYPREPVVASFTRPTDNNRQVVTYPTRAMHDLGLSITGVPTSVVYNEFDQIRDFLRNAKTGRPLRYYRDRTNALPETKSNPFGYSTWQARPDQCALDLDPTHRNYIKLWEKRLELWAYV